MGAALSTAAALDAYVLSDRGSWLAFKYPGDLALMVEGDKRLFNQYSVMLVNPAKHPTVKKDLGQQFVDWLISPEGQNAIAGYKIKGQQLFFRTRTSQTPDGCIHVTRSGWSPNFCLHLNKGLESIVATGFCGLLTNK
jgi:ABC-type tungstate transport system permease subunit